jgi:hypothetical protein
LCAGTDANSRTVPGYDKPQSIVKFLGTVVHWDLRLIAGRSNPYYTYSKHTDNHIRRFPEAGESCALIDGQTPRAYRETNLEQVNDSNSPTSQATIRNNRQGTSWQLEMKPAEVWLLCDSPGGYTWIKLQSRLLARRRRGLEARLRIGSRNTT